MPSAPKVFLSYCHNDSEWKDRVVTHLNSMVQQEDIDLWHDGMIDTGDTWFDNITEAIEHADIGICLLSPGFLASSFITQQEVPAMLEKCQRGDFIFFPVLIKPCGWKFNYALKPFQVWHKDGRGIAEFRGAVKQDKLLSEMLEDLYEQLQRKKQTSFGLSTDTLPSLPSTINSATSVSSLENNNTKIDISRLPQTGSELFGRDEELNKLDEAWQDKHNHIVSLIAWGGVGKSTLMNRWVEFLKKDDYRDAQRVFAWSFYSQGTLGQVASGDEFMFTALEWFGDDNPGEGSAYQRGQRLAGLIQQHKTLLLLDGLEPLQSGFEVDYGKVQDQGLAALLRYLAMENQGLCVISSRIKVADIERYTRQSQIISLDKLSPKDGRALLRFSRVSGEDSQLERIVTAFGGHALALGLLPGYLEGVKQHSARDALAIPDLFHVSVDAGKHPRRVIAVLFRQLQQKAQNLDIEESLTLTFIACQELLLLLGLFDRPVAKAILLELIAKPPIPGLTEVLHRHGETALCGAIEQLRRIKLLAPRNENDIDKIDCHPLIREHFSDTLKSKHQAWRAAHSHLYVYYKGLPKKRLPDTLAEMEPLLHAVRHGCLAGHTQSVLDEVYLPRIQRTNDNYLLWQLGAYTTDLACIANFFAQPWQMPDPHLSPDDVAKVLSWSGSRLRAMGRLQEARELMTASTKFAIDEQDFRSIASRAGLLSGVSLLLGQVITAVEYGTQAVECADKSLNDFLMESRRTTLGDALLQYGQFFEAEQWFAGAERLQRQTQPENLYLYSLRGFRYCDYLFTQGLVDEVIIRATVALEVSTQNSWLLNIALDQLILGKASYVQALMKQPVPKLIETQHKIEKSVADLRDAGQLDYVCTGLFIRTQLFLELANSQQVNKCHYLKSAWQDINEIDEIIITGDMKLYQVDYHLCVCRLLYAQLAINSNLEYWQIWQDGEAINCHRLEMQNRFYQNRDKAEHLIKQTGYNRRLAELENLKQIDIAQPDFIQQPRPDWLPPFVNKHNPKSICL